MKSKAELITEVKTEEHLEVVEEQEVVNKEEEAASKLETMNIKVQSLQEAMEEEDLMEKEGLINYKFNVSIAKNMVIILHIVGIKLLAMLKERITTLKKKAKKSMLFC